jgi:acyl-CoA synthetase (AMP-forming)/AMP-acid ligase II/ankyrin repeat protein
MTERWEQRPAIIWNIRTRKGETNHQGYSTSSASSYWDMNPFLDYRYSVGQRHDEPTSDAFMTTTLNHWGLSNDTPVASLSYREVLQCTQIICHLIRQKIQLEIVENCHRLDISQISQSSSTTTITTATKLEPVLPPTQNDTVVAIPIPVAVAIPEGPWLALTVTAVHALNKPFPLTSKDEHNVTFLCWASAVLVPLEPTEGKDRLVSMLQDACPLMILTASDRDHQRIASALASMEINTTSHDSPLYQTNQIHIIDVRSVFPNNKEKASIKIPLMNTTYPKSTSFMNTLEIWCSSSAPENEIDRHLLNNRQHLNGNRISHVVFTSGTTGRPKGCVSSIRALMHYISAKNKAHAVDEKSVVLLASAVSFDPCLSDILATFAAKATLAICPRSAWLEALPSVLQSLHVSHILCTPTVWGNMPGPVRKSDFPHLRVIALGGERIPKRITREWARSASAAFAATCDDASQKREPRLCATFGVTEACVYQTFGEVCSDVLESPGQNVGTALHGMNYRICREDQQDQLIDVGRNDYPECVGEIVLSGIQLDEFSCYLKRPDLTKTKFVVQESQTFYRTGDRGYVASAGLNVLGRIAGEDGMVKFNGVRIELGEIEAALIDDQGQIVTDAIVVARFEDDAKESNVTKELHAYLVLSFPCQNELGLVELSDAGVLCTEGPLLLLLQERCKRKARIVPSAFVLVARIPLSPTGKRSRRSAPSLTESVPLISLLDADESSFPLSQHSDVGKFVAETIKDCLNLQPSQEKLLTTKATFSMLGGDSLAATRIVRAIYAKHHQVVDSRLLGGKYGVLDGPFAVGHLLKSRNLGEYVDWLKKCGVGEPNHDGGCSQKITPNEIDPDPLQDTLFGNQGALPTSSEEAQLYNALLEATMRGQYSIALALLDLGVDPNFGAHGGRLAKTSSRLDRKKKFHSSPLHYACLKGNPLLVEKLLEKGALFNSPDASGLFPIHLVAMGQYHLDRTFDEDRRRRRCVELLLQAGVPLFMKDGSRQTALHTAARGGHCQVLRYLLEKWREQINVDPRRYQSSLDWRDNWSRTPVHWATLHGNVDALALLLEYGCDPNPPKPKAGLSSAAIESPLEICSRVHGESVLGRDIANLLQRKESIDC